MISPRTKHHAHELAAYLVAVIATILGIWSGWKYDPAWVGRAGSVVIVAGVALAASRKNETFHEKVLKFVDEHRKRNPDLVRDEFRKLEGIDPTNEQVRALEDAIYSSAKEDVAVLMNERRWAFKLHEVGIVIFGTLLNGFGQWLLEWVKRCAT